MQDSNGYKAPLLYVADYAQAGIYEADLLAGTAVQELVCREACTLAPTPPSLAKSCHTAPMVATSTLNGCTPATYCSDKLTLQIGRKRLPLFYYSETQDVGFAFPFWVRLLHSPMGWEIVNYNGINVLYRDRWGRRPSGLNHFGGNERRDDNPFWKIYNGRSTKTDSQWSNESGCGSSTAIGLSCGVLTSNPKSRTALKPDSRPALQLLAASRSKNLHGFLGHRLQELDAAQ